MIDRILFKIEQEDYEAYLLLDNSIHTVIEKFKNKFKVIIPQNEIEINKTIEWFKDYMRGETDKYFVNEKYIPINPHIGDCLEISNSKKYKVNEDFKEAYFKYLSLKPFKLDLGFNLIIEIGGPPILDYNLFVEWSKKLLSIMDTSLDIGQIQPHIKNEYKKEVLLRLIKDLNDNVISKENTHLLLKSIVKGEVEFLNKELEFLSNPHEIKGNEKKIVWKSSPSHFGYLISELINKDFFDNLPMHKGEINYSEIGRLFSSIIEFNTSDQIISKSFNPNSEKISDTVKNKFQIPKLNDIIPSNRPKPKK